MNRRHFLRMFGGALPLGFALGQTSILAKIAGWLKPKPKRVSFAGKVLAVDKHASAGRIDALSLDHWYRVGKMGEDQRAAWDNTGIIVSKIYD